MTVAELIAELQTHDPNMIVGVLENKDCGTVLVSDTIEKINVHTWMVNPSGYGSNQEWLLIKGGSNSGWRSSERRI